MFVGHYGPSFALRRTGVVALWVVFLAVQFVDVLWSLPPPESPTQFAVMALFLYFALAAAAWFVEKKRGQETS